MSFRVLSTAERLKLKYTNKDAYKEYKYLLKVQNKPNVNLHHLFKAVTHIKHSGNCGDIIYSLPAAFALAKNGTVHFHLHANQNTHYPKQYTHPLGNVMLNNDMIQRLQPLLLHQPQIEVCDFYKNQNIDYDFDATRSQAFAGEKGNIARWYFYVFAIYADLGKPWLTAPSDNRFSDTLVIARSSRYNAPNIRYSFLQKYSNLLFVGLPAEYEAMKQQIPSLQYYPTADFLELATVINSCKLFIGNQSFPFSIAEGLKVKRLLELYHFAPNVVVEGYGAYDFYYQEHFEKMVQELYEEK